MKNSLVIFALFFLFGFPLSAQAQGDDMDAFTVQVDGLGCPFCAYGLEKKFKELKGIKKVKIEMETGVMTFAFPAEPPLTIAAVEQQVNKAGYTPVRVNIMRASGMEEDSAAEPSTTDTPLGELTDYSLYVAGNCGMCEARIEKAAREVPGVQSADWDKETQQLRVEMTAETDRATVAQAVAKVGHDTKSVKADDATYDALPGCCQYERDNQ